LESKNVFTALELIRFPELILFGSGYAKNVVTSILKKIANDPRN
jgi:hypothetical protein